MSGNLCRCTGYVGIIRAVSGVIESRRARGIAAIPAAGRHAIGPAGSGHATATEVLPGAAVSAAAPHAAMAAPIGPAGDFTPLVSLTQSIVVHQPREAVWNFLARPSEVAACLPGASVFDGDANTVTGKMRIKVGPIAAQFEGVAAIARDPSTFSGTIRGSGRDTRSNSATQGEIRYRLVPEGERATRVELAVGYTLTGPLAQFNRSALVADIAGRLTKTFAQNLEARLAAPGASAPAAAELNAGSLVFAAMAGRIKAWVRKMLGRKNA
jgi:carbon-monoxide dehydrogenase small subunit